MSAPTQAAWQAFDLAALPAGWSPNPERVQSSLDDYETSTAQTMRLMARHAVDALSDPAVQSIAARCAGAWGRGPVENRACWDCFWFCKHWIRFKVDESSIWRFWNETDQVDFLISPSVLIRMRKPAGDCDDFSMMIAALLMANGIPCEFVTVACDRKEPRRWSHVYVRAILPDGRHVPLDPTSGSYPGWEVPARDIYRMQAWDMNGLPVHTAASSRPVAGLQAYFARGLGDDSGISDTVGLPSDIIGIDTSTGLLTSTSGPIGSGIVISDLSPGSSSTIGSGAGSSINWGSVINNLLGAGTKLTQEAILPAGSSLLPNGSIISTSGAASGLLSPGGTTNIGSLLLYGGLALALVLVIGAAKK